jgi:hypothetical protein
MIGLNMEYNCTFNVALLFLHVVRTSVWMEFPASLANETHYHR